MRGHGDFVPRKDRGSAGRNGLCQKIKMKSTQKRKKGKKEGRKDKGSK